MLVASPQLLDPNFRHTIVLLTQESVDGAMGWVINRRADVTMAEVLTQLEFSSKLHPDSPVYWGGPVSPGSGFVLYSGEPILPDPTRMQLAHDLSVSCSRTTLEWIVKMETPPWFMLCLGYAGWNPGQLDAEIERGGWISFEYDSSLLFGTPEAVRWEHAIAKLGVAREQIWMHAVIDE